MNKMFNSESEKALRKLRDKLLEKKETNHYTTYDLYIQTGVSYRELSDILQGKRNDIRLSTMLDICNGLEIPIYTIIDIDKDKKVESYYIDKFSKSFVFTNGKITFHLKA